MTAFDTAVRADQAPTRRGAVPLGILSEDVHVCDHIAYLWETQEQFLEGIRFLEVGLRGDDHCVIFGHDEANAEMVRVLETEDFDTNQLIADGRLTVLGGDLSGDAILSRIGETFTSAIDRGAPLIRLLGNIGWGKTGWPEDRALLSFEAKVTAAARVFPCVVVCMYDVRGLAGTVLLHGAFETHPITVYGNLLRENPYYVEPEKFLRRLEGEE